MKTLFPLAVILAVSLVLAEEPPPPPPPGPEPTGPEPPGPEPPGPQPPGDKHELQVSFKSSSLDLKKQVGGVETFKLKATTRSFGQRNFRLNLENNPGIHTMASSIEMRPIHT